MRKYFIALVAVIATLGTFAAEIGDIPVEVNALPATAKHFLKTKFPNSDVVYAVKDVDFASVEYKVMLSEGIVIEFNKRGEWKEIDGKGKPLSEAVLPEVVRKMVQQKFSGTVVTCISLDKDNYEVKLNNGLEVELTSSGKIIDVEN